MSQSSSQGQGQQGKRTALQEFASLEWLESLISFISNLLAILAEPFLAFGLISSAIDYGTQGHFLGSNPGLSLWWTITQSMALEGSGGVALAMSMEASKENDIVKSRIQRTLGVTLLLVGGVMFFVSIAFGALGKSEATLPDWYVYTMSALRAAVSIGYIAVRRTHMHRFSGIAPAQAIAQSVREQVSELTAQLRTAQQNAAQALSTEMRTLFQELNAQLRTAQQNAHATMSTELFAQLAAQLRESMSTMHDEMSAQLHAQLRTAQQTMHPAESQIAQAVNIHVGHALQRLSEIDELMARVAQLTTVVTEIQARPALQLPEHTSLHGAQRMTRDVVRKKGNVRNGDSAQRHHDEPLLSAQRTVRTPEDIRASVFAYIRTVLSEEQGRMPTVERIMSECGCAKNTAGGYRKEFRLKEFRLVEDSNDNNANHQETID